MRAAVAAGARPAEGALAHFSLAIWPVGDRYRMLLALRNLGTERVAALLEPARVEVTVIVERGERDGVFHAHLPPAILSAAPEAMTVALLEEVASAGQSRCLRARRADQWRRRSVIWDS